MIRSQLFCKAEPVFRKIDCNDSSCAQHSRLHDEAHAERAGANHDYGIVEAKRLARKGRDLFRTIQSDRDRHDLGQNSNFRR